MNLQRTTSSKNIKVDRKWHLIDASKGSLGRVCTKIASILMGKDKVGYSFQSDIGDYVVCINASNLNVTGKKMTDKIYNSYSGFPGGLKSLSLKELMNKDASLVIISGVRNMLPKNKLRDIRMRRLKIFLNSEHSYSDKIGK